ncbi:hypothetical protein HanRHA438_Chr08g0358691 [Helianthus annuus]|nr:hypothetical protein HanRHA438_Chr08g0358691 [Helianthus annuus]
MVFQLSFNSFTLNALKTDRIGACSNLLHFHVDALVQDLDSIHEMLISGLNMNNQLEPGTVQTRVIRVRSAHLGRDRGSVVQVRSIGLPPDRPAFRSGCTWFYT